MSKPFGIVFTTTKEGEREINELWDEVEVLRPGEEPVLLIKFRDEDKDGVTLQEVIKIVLQRAQAELERRPLMALDMTVLKLQEALIWDKRKTQIQGDFRD